MRGEWRESEACVQTEFWREELELVPVAQESVGVLKLKRVIEVLVRERKE